MTMNRHLCAALPFAAAICCLLLPTVGLASELKVASDTLVRVFERDTVGKDDVMVVPVYEYLRLDAGALSSKGLSFHLYGWGRADLGERDFFKDDTAGELLYGYLEYSQAATNLNLRLGRQYVFAGVANEAVDGLRLSSDLGPYFSVSAYGGYPVALDSSQGRSGDSIYGGRLAHRYGSLYEVGASYKKVDNDGDQEEQRVGGDLSLFLPFGASLYGISAYNLETEGWAEHSWELRFNLATLQIKPFYQKFRYEDFFGSGVKAKNPFIFLRDTDETLEVLGGDVVWPVSAAWELGARFKYYDYDKRGDSSDFTSLLANWHGQNMTSAGGEFGMMQGDAAENDYLLARAFFYRDRLGSVLPKGFVTGDLVYVDYDRPIFGEDTAFFFSLGAGHRFLEDRLELKISGDYSSDPFFDEDVRGMLVASYNYGR
jgi:hypothetical protein